MERTQKSYRRLMILILNVALGIAALWILDLMMKASQFVCHAPGCFGFPMILFIVLIYTLEYLAPDLSRGFLMMG